MPTTALKDVLLRNQILKHDVYCLNKGPNIDEHTSTDSRKRKAAPDDDKCTWIGKYDQLADHLNQCLYGIVKCFNDGCADKVVRCKLMEHLAVCVHRMANCEHCNDVVKAAAMFNHLRQCPKVVVSCECGFECTRDALTAHRDKDCPLVEICCDVIGCDAKMMRGDYEKHQERAASHHVRLLSTALGKSLEENSRLSATVQKIVSAVSTTTNSMQLKVRLTDIAAKLREAAVEEKFYYSARFDVLCHGNHKLNMAARIQGNKLGLYLHKDVAMSDDKGSLDIGGSSISVTKAGLIGKKLTFELGEDFISAPSWGRGYKNFFKDMTPYIDNDRINIVLDLKLNSVNEPVLF